MPRKKSEETQKPTTTTTRKKRTSRKPSVGLGDTIEKVTTATGIKRAIKFLAGEDCGCEERKEKLNKLFRYKKPLCLTEEEYHWLDEFKTEETIELKKPELDKLAAIVTGKHNGFL